MYLEKQIIDTVSLENREACFAKHSIFCLLTPAAIHSLALLAKEVHFNAGEVIVSEGSFFDGFFLIVSGNATVIRSLERVEKNRIKQVAILGPGDAIGLANIGFFTQNGIRSATVITASSMILLHVNLPDFYFFLLEYGTTYPLLKQMCEKFLFVNYLYNPRLLGQQPIKRVKEFYKNFNKISIPAKNNIFKQGDIAEKCYLILAGKVIVSSIDQRQADSFPITLGVLTIFGNESLISGEKRAIQAYAETKVELLVLEFTQVAEILKGDLYSGLPINKVFLEQIRPIAKKNVTLLEKEGVLENNKEANLSSIEGITLKISHQEKLIWQQINDKNTLNDILSKEKDGLKEFNIYEIYFVVMKFKNLGFVEFEEIDYSTQSKSFYKKIIRKITSFWNGKQS